MKTCLGNVQECLLFYIYNGEQDFFQVVFLPWKGRSKMDVAS